MNCSDAHGLTPLIAVHYLCGCYHFASTEDVLAEAKRRRDAVTDEDHKWRLRHDALFDEAEKIRIERDDLRETLRKIRTEA